MTRARQLLLVLVLLMPSAMRGRADEAPTPSTGPLYAAPTTLDGAGRVVIPVVVNGQGPFRFLLDTGANRSALTSRLAARLGLAVSNEEAVQLQGVTGGAVVGTAEIDSLVAGALRIDRTRLPVLDATLDRVDGVLGVEAFGNKRLVVDFDHDRVVIEDSRSGPPSPRLTVLPARFRHGLLLVVDAYVGRIRVSAVLDSGAESTLGNLALRRALQKKLAKDANLGSASVQGVTAEVKEGELITTPIIEFRGIEIAGINMAYGDFNVFKLWDLERQPAILVGMDVLGTVSQIVFDYGRREVQVRPKPRA